MLVVNDRRYVSRTQYVAEGVLGKGTDTHPAEGI